ncbi:hypothetical protein FJTKL_00049 [Diaporthe vaccinii]|uniref:Secreted protein n=1 Tax=Diaporthe vaccinii TaxID=105482 RepID=A0ABR4E4I9_9PEZI
MVRDVSSVISTKCRFCFLLLLAASSAVRMSLGSVTTSSILLKSNMTSLTRLVALARPLEMYDSRLPSVTRPTSLPPVGERTGSWSKPLSRIVSMALEPEGPDRLAAVGVARPPLLLRGSLDLGAVDGRQQVVGGQPVVVRELGEVAPDAVREDHDHCVLLVEVQVLHGAHHGRHSGARRPTNEQTLLSNQPARVHKRLAVLCLVPLVHDLAVQHIWDEVVADALQLVRNVRELALVQSLWQGKDTAERVGCDDLDVLAVLPDTLRNAADRATGSCAGDDGRHLTVSLLPDLLGGAVLVGSRVVDVGVLVQDVGAGDLLLQPPRDANV